ncbi:hypothetical protein BJV74DRAFT_881693 [Russula compacta]|nr:hypothetical protein BJV74DRAFT_881693 [Russula compacta]
MSDAERTLWCLIERDTNTFKFDARDLALWKVRYFWKGVLYHDPYVNTEESNVISKITEAVEKKEPLHLVPLAPNFPAVDSIIYDPNDAKAVLTCIQVTITEKHPIAVKSLQRVQSWLNPNHSSLKYLRPTKTKPWRFLFVVPSDKASGFVTPKFG